MRNDDAYANGPHIANAAAFPERWAEKAEAWRLHEMTAGRARLNLSYGEKPRNQFDFFQPSGKARGTLIFVHGGYWRAFDNKSWSHLARGATEQGWAVAMPSYTLCPEAMIAEITAEIRAALHHVAAMTKGPIVLAGHSAGGHLVARMLCRDVSLDPEVAARLSRVMPVSPLSDLRPLTETEMNADFRLTEATAWDESPLRERRPLPVPVTCLVGGDERPAFIDQATWLAEAWNADVMIAPEVHHFNVIDAFEDPLSDALKTLLKV